MIAKSAKKYFVVVFLLSLTVLFSFYMHGFTQNTQTETAFEPIKVSIIVPVYNTEKYLDECLESLENQTLKEIEIICVNDGSKDNSLQVLQNHASKDSRIKIINQQNAGVSAARNAGIEAAQGVFIIFADSDDVIVPYAYEKAYNDAVKYGVDVVGFNLMTFNDGEPLDLSSFKYDESKVKRCGRTSYQNPFEYMVENTAYVVTKLFKRSFIIDNNLRFKEGVTNYEDGLFNFLAFPLITEMIQDDNVFYCYRLNRPNSAVTAFNAKKVLNSSLKVAEEIIAHHNLFEFRRGNAWVLTKILDINYNHIVKDTTDPDDKKHYAKELLKILDEKYLSVYNIYPSKGAVKLIDNLRAIAK